MGEEGKALEESWEEVRLINRKVPVASSVRDSRARPKARQSGALVSGSETRQTTKYSILGDVRSTTLAPENGLVALESTPGRFLARGAHASWLSLFVGASNDCTAQQTAERGWSARRDRICFITQTRSVHTHATQQTVGPLYPRLHFHCTICFRW